MRTDKPDVSYPVRVVELHNQPVLVACYVENNSVIPDNASVSEHGLYFMRTLPVSVLDLPIPGFEGPLSIRVVLPEISQGSPFDYPHTQKLACSQIGNKGQIGGFAAVIDVTYVIAYVYFMSTISASEARANLYRLIDEAAETHTPVRITGKRNDAILLSAEDWAAIQETIHLLSVP